ncbi:hypothetical protein COB64_02875 [Candidatus Wolfebacteria bacterium]|nr:MAG: hypothetical protein COB64_02875 [Candidatus Wolfebacteria bacterium]
MLPFWVTLLLSISLLFYFENYFEIFFIFFVIDMLYGVHHSSFYNITLISVLIATSFYLFSVSLKKKLRFY